MNIVLNRTDVLTTCAVVIFRVKVSCITTVCLIPSTDMIRLTLTLKMATAQVVETSVTVNNSPTQDYVHLDDHAQSTYEMTPGFKKKIIDVNCSLRGTCISCDSILFSFVSNSLSYITIPKNKGKRI